MEVFREILQDLILESNKTVKQIALESGVSPAIYSYYLQGRVPTIKIVLKIAQYFDCSVDYLFGLDQHQKSHHYTNYDCDLSKFLLTYQKLLDANHLTHYKFAQQHHQFNESIIRHWQAGKVPRLDVLYVIAKELGGSIDELIGRD